MLHWPTSLKDVALAILKVPAEHLDTTRQTSINDLLIHGRREGELTVVKGFPSLSSEFSQIPGGAYNPLKSHGRDPIAGIAFRTLTAVLKKVGIRADQRRSHAATILDCLYPQGYLSSACATPRPPGEPWSADTLRKN